MQPGIYRHYKGHLYLVLSGATDEASLAPMVVYQALYDDYTIWIRTESDFTQHVAMPEYQYAGPRFTYVRDWTREDSRKHPQSLIAKHQKQIGD